MVVRLVWAANDHLGRDSPAYFLPTMSVVELSAYAKQKLIAYCIFPYFHTNVTGSIGLVGQDKRRTRQWQWQGGQAQKNIQRVVPPLAPSSTPARHALRMRLPVVRCDVGYATACRVPEPGLEGGWLQDPQNSTCYGVMTAFDSLGQRQEVIFLYRIWVASES
jgi:hypothetical protein